LQKTVKDSVCFAQPALHRFITETESLILQTDEDFISSDAFPLR